MNLFQWITVPTLGLILLFEIIGFRRPANRAYRLFRCVVWAAAALAIAFPEWVQALAPALGIGRGADLVTYFLLLFFLGATFYLYARSVRLQRQFTEVIRHIALREARRGGPGAAERSVSEQ